jgi:hypothetical protein
MKIYQYITIAALFVLSACSGSDENEPVTGDSSLLRLTATQGHSVSDLMGATRAEDGLLTASSGFVGTETVKVYFNSSTDDYYVGTTDSNTGLATLYGGLLEFPSNGSGSTSLYAVYPAAAANTGFHTVAYDQTGAAAYKQSDLMYATKSVDLSVNSVQNLAFSHQLVKLKVILTKEAGIGEVTSIKMVNVKRKVAVTPSASALTLGTPTTASDDEDGDNILIFDGSMTANNVAQTYSVVFPAQTWAGTNFIEMTADNHTVIYTLNKNDWQAGGEYTLTLNLTYAFLDTKATLIPNDWVVGDGLTMTMAPKTLAELKAWANKGNDFNYYVGYYVGKNGSIHPTQQTGDVGCIAYVSKTYVDTYHGKSRILVAALENASSAAQWGSRGTSRYTIDETTLNMIDETALNGYNNTVNLKELGQAAHPAAYAAFTYNSARPSGASKWFLPSKAQFDNIKDVLHDKLGVTSGVFWSSTESDADNAWSYSFGSGTWISGTSKTATNIVRACFYY